MALMTRIRNRAVYKYKNDREDLHLLIGKDASPIYCTQEVQEGKAYGAGGDSNHQPQISQDGLSNVHDPALDRAMELIALRLSDDQPQAVITEVVRRSLVSMQSTSWFCDLRTTFSQKPCAKPTNIFDEAAALPVQPRADHIATEGLNEDFTSCSSTTSTSTKVEELTQDRVQAPSDGDGDGPYRKKLTPLFAEELKYFLLSSQAFINLHNGLCSNPPLLDSILGEIGKQEETRRVTRTSEDVTADDLV